MPNIVASRHARTNSAGDISHGVLPKPHLANVSKPRNSNGWSYSGSNTPIETCPTSFRHYCLSEGWTVAKFRRPAPRQTISSHLQFHPLVRMQAVGHSPRATTRQDTHQHHYQSSAQASASSITSLLRPVSSTLTPQQISHTDQLCHQACPHPPLQTAVYPGKSSTDCKHATSNWRKS